MKIGLFLRAVNVGGRGKFAMTDFKAALADAGYAAAQTLGAAGTAMIEAKAAGAGLESDLEAAVAKRAGFPCDVFARSGADLANILSANPLADLAAADPARMVVVFLRRDPEPGLVATLRERIVGRETVAGGPRCLYAAYPDGQGTSKLTLSVIERALSDRGTARNWNTVRRIGELTSAS